MRVLVFRLKFFGSYKPKTTAISMTFRGAFESQSPEKALGAEKMHEG